MTQYTGSENDSAVDPSTTVIPASLESILCTEELYRRPSRPPDYQKENRALVALAKELNDWPQTILQTLADTILEVSQADSAGISLLRKEEGAERFYWPAIAGVWKPYVGGGTPREFGPCGDVLDSNSPLLLRHIERRYTYFNPVTPPVEECLLVPFYVQDKAVGTIWVVAHDDRRKFDAEDLRILRSLGTFASSAYQTLVSLDTLKSQIAERKQIEDRERQMTVESLAATAKFRAVFDQTTVFAGIMTIDGTVIDANRLCLEACGYRADEVLGRPLWECGWWRGSKEVQAAIRAATVQAAQGTSYRGVHIYHWADGTERLVDFALHPIHDNQGQIIFLHPTGVDITDLKQAEENYRTLAETLDAEVRVRTQELEQRNLEVLQQSEQLRELSKRLLQTQDEERRRIARDLHDSAGQIVAAIGMNLASLNQRIAGNPEVVKVVAESREMIQQLSKEIRTMSYLLHPPMLTENGLLYAIRWYVRGLAERSGLNIELGIADDFGRLPDDMELTIFRIVQECLTNIHRHSGGKTATIRLSRNTENVFLEIHDDGKGILDETLVAIRTQRSGVGTTGMRERVGHFKGVMDIQSNDNGTTVSATFPVPAIAQRTKAQGAD